MFATIAYVTGLFSLLLSGAMLVPMAVDLYDGNPDWQVFLTTSLIVGILALLTVMATFHHRTPFSRRLGFLVVNAVWLTSSVICALPYIFSSLDIRLSQAVFESVSGLTTVGSTAFAGLDRMPRGILMWRSLTQWIGGIGIIGMGLLLFPFLRVGGMQIFKMESSAQSDSPLPHFAQFSAWLMLIYVALTAMCAFGYGVTGMTVFEAINHAMTTLSTGGYSTRDSSFKYFHGSTMWVSIVFMILGALPFIAMLKALLSRDLRQAYDPQIPVIFGLIIGMSTLVYLTSLAYAHLPWDELVVESVFAVVSIMTTTGYVSEDWGLWGTEIMAVMIVAMLVGGAAGSTSGGFKTYRLIVMFKAMMVTMSELIYPNGVFVVRYDGRRVPDATIKSIMVFAFVFVGAWIIFTFILAATGIDTVTAFSGTLTALSNVGPGLGPVIGPVGNFSTITDVGLYVLSFAMLLGRLEILTILVLFSPLFWKT